MARITIVELHEKLEQANKIIDAQQRQINDVYKQYEDTISKIEYDTLLQQYKDLENKYNVLQSLYRKKNKKKHNERGAGRKAKVEKDVVLKLKSDGLSNAEIAQRLDVSIRTIQRALSDILNSTGL